jgi:hypothetical protein
MESLLPFAAVMALVIIVAVIGWRLERKRRERLAAVAAQLGFRLVDRDDTLLERFRGYGSPFDRGFDRRAEHIMTGSYDGRPAIAWDLTYHTWESRTVNGKSQRRKQAHRYAVVCVTMPRSYPDLSVSPEGPLGRMWGRLTDTDVQFESDDFNQAFTVNSTDRRFASDVIHPRMMQMLLAECSDVAWQMTDDQIMSITSGRLDPDSLPRLLHVLDAVLDQVPPHVADSTWS